MENTAVVIPVFNSADYLPGLFSRLRKLCNADQVFLVDDGSSDGSPDICRAAGYTPLCLPRNRGKSEVLRTGLTLAWKAGYRFAATIDSDLQHPPEMLPSFIDRQRRYDADLVIGRRDFTVGVMPFPRIVSNTITSWLIGLIAGFPVWDSQSGYRLYRLSRTMEIETSGQRFQYETEILIRLCQDGTTIQFTDIPTIYQGQKSHIQHLRDIREFIAVYCRSALTKPRRSNYVTRR